MSEQDRIPIQPQQPGIPSAQTQAMPQSADGVDAAAEAFQMPYAPFDHPAAAQQPYAQPAPYVQPPMPPMPEPAAPRGNGLAVGALICGILAIVLSFTIALGIILGIVAIVLAILAKHKAADGKATAGLVCGIVGIVFAILTTALLFAGVSIMDSAINEAMENAPESTPAVPEGDVSDTLVGSWALSSIEVDEENATGSIDPDDLDFLQYVDLESIRVNIFEDGTYNLDALGITSTGTWEADADTISLHEDGVVIGDESPLHYSIEGGELTLSDEGVKIVFTKMSDTPTPLAPGSEELKEGEEDVS